MKSENKILYDTCTNVPVFDSGSKFLLEILVISTQKNPMNDDLYAFQRTKVPKLSREPNDLKVALGEKKTFLDSLRQGFFMLYTDKKKHAYFLNTNPEYEWVTG